MKTPYSMFALVTFSAFIPHILGQETGVITDGITGFKFPGAQIVKKEPPTVKGSLSFGAAFPSTLDKDEYIGYMVAERPGGAGWTGISHTSGMAKSLLLVAWPDGQDVVTSFRYTTNYNPPVAYAGTGTSLTQLSHSVNATHFTLAYRCQKCLSWEQGGQKGNSSLKAETVLFAWAQSTKAPTKPKIATSAIAFHDAGFGVLPIDPKVAASASYEKMAAAAPKGGQPGGKAAAAPAPGKGGMPSSRFAV